MIPRPIAARALALLLVLTAGAGPAAASLPAAEEEAAITRLEDRREAVSTLLPHLDSPRAETRARACLAVGRIAGPAPDARAAASPAAMLAERLRLDPSARVRRSAALALGLLGTENAGAVLARVLAAGVEADGQVREAAVEGLGRCGPGPHPTAMARALGDDDPRVVGAALLAVWRGPATPHLDRVLELSRDSNPEIRWRAAYALMRQLGVPAAGRTPAATGARLTPDERDRVYWRMLELGEDGDVRVRLQVLRALGTRAGSSVLDAAAGDLLFRGLRHVDPRVRVEALRGLGGQLAGAGACQGLEEFLNDPNPQVRVTAIQAAARILAPAALEELLRPAVSGPAAWERAAACEATLAAWRAAGEASPALGLLRRCAADSSWAVRYAGGAALAEWLDARDPDLAVRDSLEALARRFFADEPRVAKSVAAQWAVLAAARAGGPASVLDAIRPLLAHQDEVLRVLALDGLSRHLEARGDTLPEHLRPFLERLEAFASDPSADVRTSFAVLCGRGATGADGDRPTEVLLGMAAGDPERRVREAAILELRERTPPGSPVARRVARLEPGPQETGWSLADYRRALDTARAAREAVLETGDGRVRVRLLGAIAPLTVCSFVRLAESGYFDDGAWHRVVPDFVAQDGCPRGDGWGGPGRTIRCEYNAQHYATGTLGMALSGKDTGGSQFFFTLSDQPHLDGRYTIFGRVLEGQEILGRLAQGDPIRRVEIRYDGPKPAGPR